MPRPSRSPVPSSAVPAPQWRWIHGLAAIGLLLRGVVAIAFEQVHHPDEVFQYWEQAHRWVFGYGYIPWEYRYGIRSWLIASLLAAPLQLCKILHLDQPSVYIPLIQTLLCLLSVSAIYSAYFIGRNLSSERSGKLASLFVACWYELIYFAHKPTPEVLGAYCFLVALAMATTPARSRFLSPLQWGILWGISSALTVALRLQYLPPIALVGLLVLGRQQWRMLAGGLCGAGVIALGVGWLDAVTWGAPFASYIQNYLFNKVHGVSSLFGISPRFYYFEGLAYASGVFPLLLLFWSRPIFRRCWVLFTTIATVVLTHTWIPHKEYRFIFLVIPLWLLLVAIVLDHYSSRPHDRPSLRAGFQSWPRSLPSLPLKPWLGIAAVVILGIGGLVVPPAQGIYRGFYSVPQFSTLYSLFHRQPSLDSYLHLAQEPQLWGVLNLAYPWFETGGYSYLHRDVPIYFEEHRALWAGQPESAYVSHVICEVAAPNCPQEPEFERWRQVGDLEIWRSTTVPTTPKTLDLDLKNVLQGGVDDRYTPNVTPYFPK